MTLGLTNGSQLGGMQEENDNHIYVKTGAYGKPIGTPWISGGMHDETLGVTLDSTMSGIVADFSSNTLVCKYIIKY